MDESKPLDGPRAVSDLLIYLDGAYSSSDGDKNDITSKLQQLKILGRQRENCSPIFNKEGMQTLINYGFDFDHLAASREARRCLANALFLEDSTRKVACDLSCPMKATSKLEKAEAEDEFVICRILLLLTYEKTSDFGSLLKSYRLANILNENLARHALQYQQNGIRLKPSQEADMALCELAQLLFNVTHFFPDKLNLFDDSIVPISQIIHSRRLGKNPLEAPINLLINVLINLDLEAKEVDTESDGSLYFPKEDSCVNATRLVDILNKALESQKESELDSSAIPLMALLRKIYDVGPSQVRKRLQELILPTDEDRLQPLGRSDSLPSRMLRLSTSALAPMISESTSSFLFELSGKDATKFIHNVGYGYASGFLMSHNIAVPQEWQREAADSRNDIGSDRQGRPINPITGQRIDREPQPTLAEMTEEEKEREAERLFVLFERLKKTGIVNVQNPVEKARDEGRFEEVD